MRASSNAFVVLMFLVSSVASYGVPSLDEEVRTSLRLESRDARRASAIGSDVLLYSLGAAPFLLDTFALTWWRDSNREQALRMLWIDSIAMGATILSTTIAKFAVGRERPYVLDCGTSEASSSCGSRDSRRSFWSGHTSTAFAGASLICGHAVRLELFGSSPSSKALGCALPLSLAAATGLLRITSDKHFFTDVLVGAAVGALFGSLVPRIFGEKTTVELAPAPNPQITLRLVF